MSADRHQIIRDAFAAWNAGERDFNEETTHPEFVLHSALTSADFHGPDGFRSWTAEIDEQFERWSVEFEALEDAPDGRVLALGMIRFVGRSSGIESEQEAGWVFRFEGDRVIEMWNIPDHAAARREAGIPATPAEFVAAAVTRFPGDLVAIVRDDGRWKAWVEEIRAALHPDFELVRSEAVSGLAGGERMRRGIESLREYWRDFTDPFDAYSEVADEVVPVDGGRVLVLGHSQATLSAGGSKMTQEGAVIITVEDCLIRRMEFFFGDRPAAMREAGLEP